jgi:putative zinc finger/helix-turn-helix YgiT family protein
MEDWEMRCTECQRAEMITNKETIRYEECGLPNVVLKNIEVERCPECGNELISIPAISGLHRTIALHLIQQPERITVAEIRFLRKHMGWSKSDFARKLHVRAEQVSRWESESHPVPMNKQSELLLRSLVAIGNKVKKYDESIDKLSLEKAEKPSMLSMFFDRSWHNGLIAAC